MFYHVLIETKEKVGKSKNNRIIYLKDNPNLSEIISEIVAPYLRGQDFYYEGFNLNKSSIVRLVVKKSERTTDQLAEEATKELPRNFIMFIGGDDMVDSDRTTDITKEAYKMAEELAQNTAPKAVKSIAPPKTAASKKEEVFIVHGHDDGVKNEVARFIEKMNFTAIILHEQASGGKTIIEKIEANADVGFAVVLYTPCDMGRAQADKTLQPRARQNVVFEHGYMIGKLGRNRVCALVKGDTEKPTDIAGIVYISMDNGNWHVDLAKEMRAAGYPIDMNKVI